MARGARGAYLPEPTKGNRVDASRASGDGARGLLEGTAKHVSTPSIATCAVTASKPAARLGGSPEDDAEARAGQVPNYERGAERDERTGCARAASPRRLSPATW